jgi:hypothetical protein
LKKYVTLLGFLLFVVAQPTCSIAAASDEPAERMAVQRVFLSSHLEKSWFAPSWSDMPGIFAFDMLSTIVAQCHSKFGPYSSIDRVANHKYKVNLAHGACYGQIELNDRGLIEGMTVAFSPNEE